MSNTTKHTPEPWRIGDAGLTVFGPPNGQPAPEIIAPSRNRANAARIVACVNACAGIADPAEAFALARAALKAVCNCVEDLPIARGLRIPAREALRALGG